MKSKDYDYIDKFKEISLREICKDLYLDPSNLYAHRMSKQQVHRVRVELEKRINELSEKKDYRKIRSKKRELKRNLERGLNNEKENKFNCSF